MAEQEGRPRGTVERCFILVESVVNGVQERDVSARVETVMKLNTEEKCLLRGKCRQCSAG